MRTQRSCQVAMKLTIPFKKKNISLAQLTSNESVQVKEDELIVDIPNAETIDTKYSDSYSEESFWDKTKTQAIEIGEKGIISALTLFYASLENGILYTCLKRKKSKSLRLMHTKFNFKNA